MPPRSTCMAHRLRPRVLALGRGNLREHRGLGLSRPVARRPGLSQRGGSCPPVVYLVAGKMRGKLALARSVLVRRDKGTGRSWRRGQERVLCLGFPPPLSLPFGLLRPIAFVVPRWTARAKSDGPTGASTTDSGAAAFARASARFSFPTVLPTRSLACAPTSRHSSTVPWDLGGSFLGDVGGGRGWRAASKRSANASVVYLPPPLLALRGRAGRVLQQRNHGAWRAHFLGR